MKMIMNVKIFSVNKIKYFLYIAINQIIIANSSFKNNIAKISGGGIHQERKIFSWEETLKKLYFSQNNALYGQNFSSYPIRIKLNANKTMINKKNQITLTTHPGEKLNYRIEYMFYDHFNQKVTLDYSQ